MGREEGREEGRGRERGREGGCEREGGIVGGREWIEAGWMLTLCLTEGGLL